MELRVAFRQTNLVPTVFGGRLEPKVAAGFSQLFGDRFRNYEVEGMWQSWRHENGRMNMSEKGLWVLLKPGQPPMTIPSLEDLAKVEELDDWKKCIERFGLPDHRGIKVAELAGQVRELLFVRLDQLDTVARRARFLVACERAALGLVEPLRQELIRLDGLRKVHIAIGARRGSYAQHGLGWDLRELPHPERLTDAAIADFAREVVAMALEEALRSVEPAASIEPRGISDTWGLFARGWWPLAVLQEFVHRSRYDPTPICASPDCSLPVPPGRRRYCSKRCRERERKRRWRSRAARRLAPNPD